MKYKLSNLVDLLIEKGVDINSKSKYGNTSVHIACGNNLTEILNKLISHGGGINVQNEDGYTPLIYAVSNQFIDIVELLMINGANPEIRENDGHDAWWYNLQKDRFGNLNQIKNNTIQELLGNTN